MRRILPPASIARDTIARKAWCDLAPLLLAEKRFGPQSRAVLERYCLTHAEGERAADMMCGLSTTRGRIAAENRWLRAQRVLLRCLTALALTPRSRTQRLERLTRARDAVPRAAQRERQTRRAVASAKRKGTPAAICKAEAAHERAGNAHTRARARLDAVLHKDSQ